MQLHECAKSLIGSCVQNTWSLSDDAILKVCVSSKKEIKAEKSRSLGVGSYGLYIA